MTRQDWIEALSIAALIVTAAGLLGAAWVIANDLTRWGR
jgi:hypothetical protein